MHPLRIYFVLLIAFTYAIFSEAARGDTLEIVVNGDTLKVKDGRLRPDSSEPLTLIETSAVPNYQQSSSGSNYAPSSGPPQWPMWSFPPMPSFQWWNPWSFMGAPANGGSSSSSSSNSDKSDDDKKSQKGRLG